MNDIINVNYDGEQPTVSARELHKNLEVKYDFTRWVDSNFKEFVENVDYSGGHIDVRGNQHGGIQTIEDYNLTIDMAKHLCLMSKTKKGKECRQQLIDLEKAWNTPEQVMARALDIAHKTIDKIKCQNQQLIVDNSSLHKEISVKNQIIGELKPKADYTDLILKSKATVTITQIAKDYGMSGQQMNRILHDLGVQYKESGQWLLYNKYQDKGYTHSETIDITLSDGRPDVRMNTKWLQKGRLFLYELLKQNGYLPMIEQY